MCSIECNKTFWSSLEIEMHQTLPEVIKYILAVTGFESDICLRNITSADISNIESYIDKNKLRWMEKYEKLYGLQSRKTAFRLLPGHSKIIFEISEHYKRKAVSTNESARKGKYRVESAVRCESVSINVCIH